MATWAYLNHDECKLPTLEECKKVHAKTGSVVKCGDSATGCGRLWLLLLEEGKWIEVSPKVETYLPTRNAVPVEGADKEQRRPTVTEKEVDDARYRLELSIAASVALKSTAAKNGEELTYFAQRERMLDL